MVAMLKQLFWVSRPVSWVNTAYPFAAGYFMASRSLDWQLLMGTLFFLVPYNVIMYGVNDVFDYDSDIRNPRKGGIEGAVAAKRLHKPILLTSALLGVPFLALFAATGTVQSSLVLFGVMAMVIAYSAPHLRFKERPVLDSITSSSHFCGPLLYGVILAGWSSAAWPAVVAFFLWGMASHAFGAVQDILPDREGNVASIATVFGAAPTVRFALILYAVSGFVLTIYGWPLGLISLVALLYVENCRPFWNVADAQSARANAGWRRFLWLNQIAGFCVTLALLYVSLG